jgi:hypothetical protein
LEKGSEWRNLHNKQARDAVQTDFVNTREFDYFYPAYIVYTFYDPCPVVYAARGV